MAFRTIAMFFAFAVLSAGGIGQAVPLEATGTTTSTSTSKPTTTTTPKPPSDIQVYLTGLSDVASTYQAYMMAPGYDDEKSKATQYLITTLNTFSSKYSSADIKNCGFSLVANLCSLTPYVDPASLAMLCGPAKLPDVSQALTKACSTITAACTDPAKFVFMLLQVRNAYYDLNMVEKANVALLINSVLHTLVTITTKNFVDVTVAKVKAYATEYSSVKASLFAVLNATDVFIKRVRDLVVQHSVVWDIKQDFVAHLDDMTNKASKVLKQLLVGIEKVLLKQ